MLSGALTAVYMLAAAAATAMVLEPFVGISFTASWIAFAPGGLAEMALISLVLGADPALVATHHLYRVILLIIIAPVIFRLIKKRFDL